MTKEEHYCDLSEVSESEWTALTALEVGAGTNEYGSTSTTKIDRDAERSCTLNLTETVVDGSRTVVDLS